MKCELVSDRLQSLAASKNKE